MNAGTVAVDAMKSDRLERAIALAGAAVVLFGAVLWADRSSPEMTDFSVTYVGAKIVYQGDGAKLYDLDEQQRMKTALFTHAQPLIFEHPPFEALMLSPLGALSYRTAYLVWGFFNALIWLSLPCLLRQYLPSPRSELGYFSLWFSFTPLGVALYQGQSSVLVLFFLSLSFMALKNKRDVLSGVWLGMALLKFQFVTPFALVVLVRRRWAMMKGFAASAAALAMLSFAAVGWWGILSYANLLINVVGHPRNLSYGAARDMATLQSFLGVIFGATLSSAAIHILSAAIAAAFLFYVAHLRQQQEIKDCGFDLCFAATIIIAMVASSHMFTHDMSPLVLASLLTAAQIPAQSNSALRIALRVLIFILWIPPLYFALVASHCMYLFLVVLMTFAAALFVAAKGPKKYVQARPNYMTRLGCNRMGI